MWFIGVEIEQETSAPPPKKNPGSAPAHIPKGDRINSEAEDLLVPVFMTLNPIPEAYLERFPNCFVTCCAINTVSCMSCALSCVDVLRRR